MMAEKTIEELKAENESLRTRLQTAETSLAIAAQAHEEALAAKEETLGEATRARAAALVALGATHAEEIDRVRAEIAVATQAQLDAEKRLANYRHKANVAFASMTRMAVDQLELPTET